MRFTRVLSVERARLAGSPVLCNEIPGILWAKKQHGLTIFAQAGRYDPVNPQPSEYRMKRTLMIGMFTALSLIGRIALAEDGAKPEGGRPHGKPGEGKPGEEAPRPHKPPEEIFKKIDTNGDGSLSLDEIKESPRGKQDPAKAEEMFTKKDKDGDKKLSLAEFKVGMGKGGPGGPDKPHKKGEGHPPKEDK
jgi:hypothetical protein